MGLSVTRVLGQFTDGSEPSGNPPGPLHAARTTHARRHQR